ncbi:hypothetical protein [Flavobacterium selenitireducens]|uniref:hypothetical protein n=1 Tax=Flavobacterium selenitireducens TaxID=2722704 RepID=UPI00168AB780|nr:hypothetical protein [Flavobacterium selenitireducens]MBD3583586.1 hypothetical protein [Flavobacterium selenitireducens]
MQLIPKKGIANLLFGMKISDVESAIGKSDLHFKDDDNNAIHVYNALKLRLTFYEDESYRFGYLISGNPELELGGQKLIGQTVENVKPLLPKAFKTWETERFDLATNHFNEANWLILQEEFGTIAKVEMGAVFNDKDEVEWAFR